MSGCARWESLLTTVCCRRLAAAVFAIKLRIENFLITKYIGAPTLWKVTRAYGYFSWHMRLRWRSSRSQGRIQKMSVTHLLIRFVDLREALQRTLQRGIGSVNTQMH